MESRRLTALVPDVLKALRQSIRGPDRYDTHVVAGNRHCCARSRAGEDGFVGLGNLAQRVAKHARLTGDAANCFLARRSNESPAFVAYDVDYNNRECFYRPSPLPPPRDRLWVKVVVEFDAFGAGEVVTVYLTNRKKPGERQKWP